MKQQVLLVVVAASLTLAAATLFYGLCLRPREAITPTNPDPPEDVLVVRGLPPLKLDTRGINPDKTYHKDYRFRKDWFSEHIPTWEACLRDYKGKPHVHYLEIGLYEGRSAFWMLENVLTHPTARLTGIDPFPEEYQYSEFKGHKDVFFSNLKLSGFEDKVTVIQGFSQIELRKLPLESFDVIYIDGSHNEADCLEDAIHCWRLLKDGGTLIFDDYLLHTKTHEKPKLAIDTFVAFFGKHFDTVHVDWQVILRKKPKASLPP